jgi:beta-aspartyl-peptidase (threonine type)
MWIAAALLATGTAAAPSQGESMSRPFRIVVHGGVGAVRAENRTPEQMAAYRTALTEAVRAGQQILAAGGPALDAVEAAVRVLEDSPHFNAGKGAVFTSEGRNELDASIMDGATRAAGAVAGVTRIQNPIALARLVMDKSPHVLLISDGAEAFAKEQGMAFVDPSYFHTERRWKELQEIQQQEKPRKVGDAREADDIYGTVGAVALDQSGHLAAATSTGGMTNKRHGRVGDSPIIGAGTYADDRACAVSGTGKGEYFIRTAAAHELCALVAYKGMSLEAAADAVVAGITALGGDGGVIAVDPAGRIALRFNTPAMCRGWSEPDGTVVVQIDRE